MADTPPPAQVEYESTTDTPMYVFAVMVCGGGIMGWLKKGSLPSLASGLLFGALLMLAASITSKDKKNVLFTLVILGALAAVMYFRWTESGKFMPAGMSCCMSTVHMARQVYRYLY